MNQTLSPSHEMPAATPPARSSAPRLALVAGALAAFAFLGAGALWFRYGATVFFETIAAGISACF